jgi:hypothetical protein
MTCPSCNDAGVFRIAYHDGSPADFALCLCKAGERMRVATNNGRPVTPQWQVWAFKQGIPLEHVAPMEDLLTDDELAARGFTTPTPGTLSREAALLAAGRKAKR